MGLLRSPRERGRVRDYLRLGRPRTRQFDAWWADYSQARGRGMTDDAAYRFANQRHARRATPRSR